MSRSKKTKNSFKRDDKGRAVLGSAKEMAEWVKIGFEEQEKRRTLDIPFEQQYIDLRNCVLYISYPVGIKKPSSQVFNLCDLAGIVPGIEKIEGDPNYLFEVKYDIFLNDSLLYGNFFHYVKFDRRVHMDKAVVQSTCSFFKCIFEDFAFMNGIQITGRCDFEQCEFKKGLVMQGAKADLFHFNYCSLNERLSLSRSSLNNRHIKRYHQSIEITNSRVENLNLSTFNTDGLPIYIVDTRINGMHCDRMELDNDFCFKSCKMDGVMTFVKGDERSSCIKKMEFFGCTIVAQCHIEDFGIERFQFSFSKVEDSGRLRLSQCVIGELTAECSSVFGQMDLTGNDIRSIGLEGTTIQGLLNFQDNIVKHYADRLTLCLLKNEALKVNDDVAATQLYAKEMNILLADKKKPFGDKASLWIYKLFSGFGDNWAQAFFVTFGLSVILTGLMLGCGSSKYAFRLDGEFMGVGPFVTSLLDSINVFSIPLFRDTIKEYDLNVLGQILYFFIKVVVAYGTYQFVVAFRKYGRM